MLDLSNPVIAAVRSDEEFLRAVRSKVTVVFLLKADVMTLGALMARKNGKKVYVHLDMADGIGKDRQGIAFVAATGADGIISTKNQLIVHAREAGLGTVQRFFIIDSLSVTSALDSLKSSKPDFAELMPGVIPKTISSFAIGARVPVIAGGLIETKREIIDALSAGAEGVSTGKAELWNQ